MSQQTPIEYPFPAAPSLYHLSPELAEVRRSAPVAPVVLADGRTAWLVTGYDDVRTVLTDPRFSRAAAAGADAVDLGLGPLATESIIGMDPPEHTRLRRLVMREFTARRVEALRPRAAKIVDELIDRMETLPRPVDLVEHFSLPLPVQVICELLGVPATDRETFHGWSDTLLGGPGSDQRVMGAAFQAMGEYLGALIHAKRAQPADDLMSALIAARDKQDKLSERELVTLCVSILIGGHETTANQINMILLTLRAFPGEQARLRARPDTVPQAVEELMRFVQLSGDGAAMPRVATEDVVLSGVTVPAGSPVVPAIGAANRDPAVFDVPDRLDLSRPELSHMSFGAGVHHCLGAQLARMELQEALRGVLRRLPDLRIVVPDEELHFKEGMLVRSLRRLPVTW